MSTPAEKAELRERAMALLAERAVLLACDLQEAAMATADPDQKARLASAFAKVSRSARQTWFLEARLDRDLARQDREERQDRVLAEKHDKTRRTQRRIHVSAAVGRMIWSEREDEVAELTEALESLLAEAVHDPGFADEPVEAHIARVSAELGLTSTPLTESPEDGAPDDGAPDDEAPGSGAPRQTAPPDGEVDWDTFDDPPRRSSA